jgi:hypothetical protein
MFYLMIPVIVVALVVLFTPPISRYFIFSYDNRGKALNRLNDGFFVFVIFLEELILIIGCYKVRDAHNDY